MILHQQETPRQYYNILVQLLRHPQLNRFTNKKVPHILHQSESSPRKRKHESQKNLQNWRNAINFIASAMPNLVDLVTNSQGRRRQRYKWQSCNHPALNSYPACSSMEHGLVAKQQQHSSGGSGGSKTVESDGDRQPPPPSITTETSVPPSPGQGDSSSSGGGKPKSKGMPGETVVAKLA